MRYYFILFFILIIVGLVAQSYEREFEKYDPPLEQDLIIPQESSLSYFHQQEMKTVLREPYIASMASSSVSSDISEPFTFTRSRPSSWSSQPSKSGSSGTPLYFSSASYSSSTVESRSDPYCTTDNYLSKYPDEGSKQAARMARNRYCSRVK